MRHLRQICSTYSVVIKVFITFHRISGTLLMTKILLNEPLTKWLLLERRHSVYHWFIEIEFRRLGETSKPSMEEIHRHVHRFVHGTRNLWRQGQCSIKGGVDDQQHPRKTSSYRLDVLCATNRARIEVHENEAKQNLNICVSFCNNFHLPVFSFAFVINFWNRKETLWTACISPEDRDRTFRTNANFRAKEIATVIAIDRFYRREGMKLLLTRVHALFQMRRTFEIAALYFLLLSIVSTYVVSVAGYKVSIEAFALRARRLT